MTIILDLEQYLVNAGYEVLVDSGKVYRLNVIRPKNFVKVAVKIDRKNESERVYQFYDVEKEKKFKVVTFMEKIKMALKYGTSWDKGYSGDSKLLNQENERSPSIDKSKQEIHFSVEIQKIKKLDLFVVEFKRLSGKIWEFKKMYEELMTDELVKLVIDSKYD
jgi:hypothetical protein